MSADHREIMVHSNEVYRADMDGVFMGLGRYQRYRQVVADRIQEAQTPCVPSQSAYHINIEQAPRSRIQLGSRDKDSLQLHRASFCLFPRA